MFETLHIVFRSGWGQLAVLGALAASLLLSLAWNRPTARVAGRRAYWILLGLHLLATVFVVLWLVNPRLRYARTAERSGTIAILADASASMSLPDAEGGATRYEAVRRLCLDPDSGLRDRLKAKSELRDYLFHGSLRDVTGTMIPPAPDPAGLTTDLGGALEALRDQARQNHVQAVILATDGADNGRTDLRRAVRDLRLPIHVVGVGRRAGPESPWRNVGIEAIEVPTQVQVDQEVELKVRLRQEGFPGIPLRVELSESSKTIDSAVLTMDAAPLQLARLRFTPRVRGVGTYRVAFHAPEGDRVRSDDAMDFTVLVTAGKIRVFFAEGTLRWEFKFLRRALGHEDSVALDTVVRTGAGKLYVQGQAGLRLRGPLPAEAEDFLKYDVVVLGDFPRPQLDDRQLRLLDSFVKERKGGLLLLGGPLLLQSGDYAGSPLDEMLPVTLPAQRGLSPLAPEAWTLQPTPEGRAAGALAGLDEWIAGLKPTRCFPIDAAKPGAETWLNARSGVRAAPLLVAQRYGQGRTLLVTADDLWKAELQGVGDTRQSPFARFWLQSLRWLARQDPADDRRDPELVAFTDKSYYDSGEAVRLKARARADEDREEAKPGSIEAEVRADGRTVARLQLPAADDSGWSLAEFKPPCDGMYRITVRLQRAGNAPVEVDCAFAAGAPGREMEHSDLDETLLREIARESGGGYYTPGNAEEIPAAVERSALASSRIVERDMTDSPLLFALFCLVASAGWILRRRRNLI